jgi:hypothetical protein
MADLIDRSALLEIVNKINAADDTFGKAFGAGAQVGVEIAANKIKEAPAVDAVEVVRCKDCKRSGMYAFGHDVTERLACLDIDAFGYVQMATSVEPMDYCSYGERRTDADN